MRATTRTAFVSVGISMALLALGACGGPEGGGVQNATGEQGREVSPANPPVDAGTPPVADAGMQPATIDCTAEGACSDTRCAREPACQHSDPMTPCDVFAQNCSDPSDRCYPYPTPTSDGQCYREGTRQAGQSCEEPPYGEPQACRKGLLCVAASDDPAVSGTCLTVCRVGRNDCAATEVCAGLDAGLETFTFGVCVAAPPPPPPLPCDVLTQARCASDQLCAVYEDAANACVPAGQGGVGASCAAAEDCERGLHCAALAGWSPTEYTLTLNDGYLGRGGGLCLKACSAQTPCGAGSACSPIGTQTGYPRPDLRLCYPNGGR